MEANGNSSTEGAVGGGQWPVPGLTPTPQGSLESLSEYADARESTASAPTEVLAEFLSAIMLKNYVQAFKYCKLILQYEPYNNTAKELYPLILEKMQLLDDASGEDEESSEGRSDGTTASYSSLEDEEADFDNGNSKSASESVTSSSDDLNNDNNVWQLAAQEATEAPGFNGNPTALSLCTDKQNGNTHRLEGAACNFIAPSSSEESSPTEPTSSQSLTQPLTQLSL